MRNLKKVLSLVLALMMVLSVMVTASAADFTDAESINYKEAVEVMAGLGVISGVKNADDTYSFLPQDTLNREAAAKIVAYIKLGGDVDANLADTLANPFSDVSGWSTNVIKYCASQGIIDGVGNGKFEPKGALNGYAFAKMLLVAAGINGEYTGSNWKYNIYTAAANAGLLEGLEDVVLSNSLTREQAAQMAFNAMNYSATGGTSAYVIKDASGAVLYRGTDAITALLLKQSDATYKLSVETVNTGSLMDVVFGAMESSSTDAFGRVSKTWISKYNAKVVYAELAPTALKSYTTETSYGKIWKDLGNTLTSQVITLNVYNNSATAAAPVAVTKGDTTKIGAAGTLVEVYATATRGVYDVVVIDTYAHKLAATDIVKAVPATATTDAVPAYITINNMPYVTNAFKKDDVVLYNVADGAIVNVVKADVAASGSVSHTSANYGYFRVDGGAALYLAAHNGAKIGTTAGYTYIKNDPTTYTYYADFYGNIIMAVAGQYVAPDVNYIYVISTAAKAATSIPGSLYGQSSVTAAAAQAQVMDLATGTISIVDQAVVYNPVAGGYFYATASGAASSTPVVDQTITKLEGLYEYTVLEDGSIVIGAKASTTSVTLNKGQAAVGSLFANGATKVTVWDYTKDAYGNYASVKETSYTGTANFPLNGVTYTNALVEVNPVNNVIISITVVKAADAVVTAPTYAVYYGAGETGAEGTAYAFMVGEKLVNYYEAAADTVSGIETLKGGEVVALTLTDGKLGTNAVSVQDALVSGEVTYVDDTFMVIGGLVYYFAQDCEVYAIGTDGSFSKGAVELGDTITVYGYDYNNNHYAAYILK